VRLKMKV